MKQRLTNRQLIEWQQPTVLLVSPAAADADTELCFTAESAGENTLWLRLNDFSRRGSPDASASTRFGFTDCVCDVFFGLSSTDFLAF